MEGVKSETSFMSEQAYIFLSSVGLLGEYCPWSRKKDKESGASVGCMHLESHQYNIHCLGCESVLVSENAQEISLSF